MPLNFFSQFAGPLGIPNHARALAQGLLNNAVDLRPVQLPVGPFDPNGYGMTREMAAKFKLRPDHKSSALVFWYPDIYKDFAYFPKNCGLFVFEYGNIPKQYVDGMNLMDSMFTCSDWGIQTLKANGVKVPVYLCPGGVDSSVFNSKNRKLDKDTFKFVHVGKVEHRKSTRELIEAFNLAFKGEPSVTLTLYIDNPHIPGFEAENYVKDLSYSLKYPVGNLRIKHFIQDPAALYSSFHAAVFPSKAEAIGLPIVEAMAAGLPVITTKNTGIQQYANEENSILLTDLKEVPIYDPYFFPRAGELGTWLAPTVEEIKDKLLWVYQHYEQAEKVGQKAEVWMKENFTWDQSAKKLLEAM